MEKVHDVYEGLAAHLDRLPAGFPRTPVGVEMRLLKRLFTPEEAALAQLLVLKPEPAEKIAAKAGQDPEQLAPKLEAMAQKGLIFRIRKDGMTFYMAAQFLIGIWEYHVNDLDPELIRDMNEYLPYFFDHSYKTKTPQLRVIPISKSLTAEHRIMPYEEARRIVEEQDQIVVAPCICRKEHQIMGKGCDHPMETCLIFGMGAQYYLDNGLGRPIDREDALKILGEAERSGLVLQPSNSQNVVNICTCCGCCCQVLKGLKRQPQPARVAATNHFAVVEADLCTGCEVCQTRCQMDAVKISDGVAEISSDRCIGCGLCIPTCPVEAIRLEMKPESERWTPPTRFSDTYKQIAMERLGRLKAVKSDK